MNFRTQSLYITLHYMYVTLNFRQRYISQFFRKYIYIDHYFWYYKFRVRISILIFLPFALNEQGFCIGAVSLWGHQNTCTNYAKFRMSRLSSFRNSNDTAVCIVDHTNFTWRMLHSSCNFNDNLRLPVTSLVSTSIYSIYSSAVLCRQFWY